ncbi:MAG: hypothetical protein IJP03_02425, partial [Christensenellaceae bacterium]|nr:hypothetical protein [Christensenellaceae bacterium]
RDRGRRHHRDAADADGSVHLQLHPPLLPAESALPPHTVAERTFSAGGRELCACLYMDRRLSFALEGPGGIAFAYGFPPGEEEGSISGIRLPDALFLLVHTRPGGELLCLQAHPRVQLIFCRAARSFSFEEGPRLLHVEKGIGDPCGRLHRQSFCLSAGGAAEAGSCLLPPTAASPSRGDLLLSFGAVLTGGFAEALSFLSPAFAAQLDFADLKDFFSLPASLHKPLCTDHTLALACPVGPHAQRIRLFSPEWSGEHICNINEQT